MAVGGIKRDEGFTAAIAAAGGLRALARKLGLHHQSVAEWGQRVPQSKVCIVAEATGLSADRIRPDLSDWLMAERSRRRLMLARERFSLASAVLSPRAASDKPTEADQVNLDMLVSLIATRFVAQARGLGVGQVIGGEAPDARAARSLAMALAHVAGRAASVNVGAFFHTSRQNVDNASERYLRARDGDDEDDFFSLGADGQGRVIERGRLRRAKQANPELWALEARFTGLVIGEAEPQRRRA